MSRATASDVRPLPRAVAIALSVLSGVGVFCAFPDWDMHYLAWFALVPLLIAGDGQRVRDGFWLGLIAGTVTNFGGFHWITSMLMEFGHLPAPIAWALLLLQAITQGFAMALGLALWRWLVRLGAPRALSAMLSLWAGEVMVPMIFPWFMGNGIAHEITMIQIADLGGVALVSAMLYASNAALAELIAGLRRGALPQLRFVSATAVCVALAFGYGIWRVPMVDDDANAAAKLKIGLVEGDVGIWEKEAKHLEPVARVQTLRKNLLKHQRMSVQLADAGAELIVWPESAYQPYGAVPIVFSTDRFAAFGAGGRALRHDGDGLVAMGRGSGLEGKGLLTGASAPRADVWRVVEDGRRVLTLAPWSQSSIELPDGEIAVDTASPEINLRNHLAPGYVLARSGRIWLLGFPPEPARENANAKPWVGALSELERLDAAAMDATAIAVSGAGDIVSVGRRGEVREVRGHAFARVDSGVDVDLWDVAGDPQGSGIIAVGNAGVILRRSAASWHVEHRGGADLLGCFFDGHGNAWAVGKGGTLLRRERGGRWRDESALLRLGATSHVDDDLHAGAADARGNLLLLGREGRAWEIEATTASPATRVRAAVTEGAELTTVLGFTPQALWMIPRRAGRVVPGAAALPNAKLEFPDDVLADEATTEFDRSTPRRAFTTPLLFGAMTFGGELAPRNAECLACYNSALLIDGDGVVQELYDKAFLLVFGEYIPFGEDFPELYDLLPESSRFQAGVRTEPMRLQRANAPDAKLGVLICYEDLLPRFASRVMAHAPHVLINLTNDAWFGQTAEPYHHMQLAQMRAVEYRRWLVRSTNTGISVFIDANGRRVAETKLTDAETLMQDVPLLEGQTVFARLGNWPPLVLLIALMLVWARALRGTTPPGGATKKRKAARNKAADAGPAPDEKPKPARKPRKPGAAGKPETLEPARLG